MYAQYQVYGGFEYGFLNLAETNNIIAEFNDRESHSIADFTALRGYRFGVGRYAKFANVELGFGSIFNRQRSQNPALLKENVEVLVNLSSLDANVAFRPFQKRFHLIGASLHMGQMRYRYSFGGDYLVPIELYGVWGEVYVDIGIPFRFLIKKEMRDELFYIFRIRPYYKFNANLDISNFQRDFNEDPSVEAGDFMEGLNHFGIRISISVPFLNPTEKELYKRTSKSK